MDALVKQWCTRLRACVAAYRGQYININEQYMNIKYEWNIIQTLTDTLTTTQLNLI